MISKVNLTTENHPHCPLCGSSDIEKISVEGPNSTTWYAPKCNNCRFVGAADSIGNHWGLNNLCYGIPEILELLHQSEDGKIDLRYSHDCMGKLCFFTKDGTINIEYDGETILDFFMELMKYFNVTNYSP